MKEKLTLNGTQILVSYVSSTNKNQPKKVKSLFLATLRVLCPREFFSTAYFNFGGKSHFLKILFLGFKNWYKRHKMSLLYTSKEFDQKTCYSYIILGFRIFLFSGGHKTPIPEDTKLVILLTRYLLLFICGLD